MKKISKLIGILALVAFTFVACGSDDDPKYENLKFSGSFVSSSNIYANANVSEGAWINGQQNTTLDSLLSGYKELYISPITGSKLHFATNACFLKIEGISKNSVLLKNVVIDVNGIQRDLGDLSSDKIVTIDDDMFFLENSLKALVNTSEQKINVKMKFKPSKDIKEDSPILLTIGYSANFDYRKYY